MLSLAFDLFIYSDATNSLSQSFIFILYFYRNPTAIPTAPNLYRTRDFKGDFPFPLPLISSQVGEAGCEGFAWCAVTEGSEEVAMNSDG